MFKANIQPAVGVVVHLGWPTTLLGQTFSAASPPFETFAVRCIIVLTAIFLSNALFNVLSTFFAFFRFSWVFFWTFHCSAFSYLFVHFLHSNMRKTNTQNTSSPLLRRHSIAIFRWKLQNTINMKNYTHSRSIQHRYQELQNTIWRLYSSLPFSSSPRSPLPSSLLFPSLYCTETWLCSSLPFSSLHFSSLLVSAILFCSLFAVFLYSYIFSCDSRLSGNSRCLYETAFEQSEWLLWIYLLAFPFH